MPIFCELSVSYIKIEMIQLAIYFNFLLFDLNIFLLYFDFLNLAYILNFLMIFICHNPLP